jgi:hypothetical protein
MRQNSATGVRMEWRRRCGGVARSAQFEAPGKVLRKLGIEVLASGVHEMGAGAGGREISKKRYSSGIGKVKTAGLKRRSVRVKYQKMSRLSPAFSPRRSELPFELQCDC